MGRTASVSWLVIAERFTDSPTGVKNMFHESGEAEPTNAEANSARQESRFLSPEGPSISHEVVDPVARPQPSSSGTYELKYLIDEACAQQVRDWASRQMQPDPHSVAEFGCGYSVNSLYLDTPAFDVLHRVDGFRQRKYRLRRYGTESVVWMELKRKNDGRVSKRRTAVEESELESRLMFPSDAPWNGIWFGNRLEKLRLRPICRVTYQRFACVGTSPTGSIRLTIDSHLCCLPAIGWQVPDRPLHSQSLLKNRQVLELKFHETIPATFRGLIEDLQLKQTSFSKYRQSVEACIPLPQIMGEDFTERAAG